MKIPDTVKIAGYTYKVERPKDPFASGESVCDGTHYFAECLIKVSQFGCEDYQNTVFWHEVIHGVLNAYCSDVISSEDEEKITERLAKGLYSFIVDNPEIFK